MISLETNPQPTKRVCESVDDSHKLNLKTANKSVIRDLRARGRSNKTFDVFLLWQSQKSMKFKQLL